MNHPIDAFGKKVCDRRKEYGLTQQELAEKLNMSRRTVLHVETGQSNPKFETVALIANYLNISLDAIVFPEGISTNAISKCVYDFFGGKTESEAEKYIALCETADDIK